jgi:NAD/NADP transhydrogenase beta subunit
MICLIVCFILAVLFGRYPDVGVFYLLGMTSVALFLGWHIGMGEEGTDIPVVPQTPALAISHSLQGSVLTATSQSSQEPP